MISDVQHDLEGGLDDVDNWWEDVYEMSQLEAGVYAVTDAIKRELSFDKTN